MASRTCEIGVARKRETVIRAALALLDQAANPDIAALDPGRLAARLGISPEEMLQLFPDDGALWLGALGWVHERLTRALEYAADTERDPLDALQLVFHRHLSFITHHPGVIRALGCVLARDSRARRRTGELLQRYEADVAFLIAMAKSQGSIRRDVDASAAARLFTSLIHGLALRHGIGHHGSDSMQAAEQVLAVSVAAIAA